MVNGQRVLVVEGMHEIQEVLQAVLAPRGLRVDWVRSHIQPHAGGTDRPDILVIDAEALPTSKSGGTSGWNNVPRVIIGEDDDSSMVGADARRTFLSKPFQFPDLVRAIEELLPGKVA